MTLAMEIGVLLAFGAGLFLIFILGRLLLRPLKFVLKLMLSSVLGALLLILINIIGAKWGMDVPVNMLNAFIVGVLGIPGAVMLTVFY